MKCNEVTRNKFSTQKWKYDVQTKRLFLYKIECDDGIINGIYESSVTHWFKGTYAKRDKGKNYKNVI